jgi:large subunit ribosomal protein L25
MTHAITASIREKKGRQAKQELRENLLPAVMYGHGTASRSISIPRSEFLKVFKLAGYSSLIDVTLNNEATVKTLIKDVQRDPVSHEPIHIDFYQVRMDEEMTATVPIRFVGESAAVKSAGGTLVKSLDEIVVKCLPKDLPHDIEVNLVSLATFEDAIAIKNIQPPAGVVFVTDAEVVIATVSRPLTEEELKKLEETSTADLSAIKTEGEEKKAAEEAKKAEQAAAEEAAK